MSARMGYRAALRWLLDNDDTEFLDHPSGTPGGALSVSASFAADIFGKRDDVLRGDLLRMRARMAEEQPHYGDHRCAVLTCKLCWEVDGKPRP